MLGSQLHLPTSTRWRASLGLWGCTCTFLPGELADPVATSNSRCDLASGLFCQLTPCCDSRLTTLPSATRTPISMPLGFLNPAHCHSSSSPH